MERFGEMERLGEMEEFGNGEIGGNQKIGGNGEIREYCEEIAEIAIEWLWFIWVTGKGDSEAEVH